ncbi:hypothetical protein RI367_005550 [Sorochytrium milnesiophthora]
MTVALQSLAGAMATTTVRVSYSIPLRPAGDDNQAASAAGHRLSVNALCIDQDAQTLYSAGRDGAVLAWDAKTHANRYVLNGHSDWVNDIKLAVDNTCLLSASSDRSVKLWRLPTGENDDTFAAHMQPTTLGYHNDYVKCLAYASATKVVASGGLDTRIALWDLHTLQNTWNNTSTGTTPQYIYATNKDHNKDPKCSIYALAATPDGSTLVSGSPDKLIRIWDPRTRRRVGQLVGHTDYVRAVLVSDDGRTVLSASSDATIKLWSLTTNRCMSMYTYHNDSVWALFSKHPDLHVFYAGSKDGMVSKMDVRQPASWSSSAQPSSTFTDDQVASPTTTTSNSLFLCHQPRAICSIAAGTPASGSSTAYVWTACAGESSLSRWKDLAIGTAGQTNGVTASGEHSPSEEPWEEWHDFDQDVNGGAALGDPVLPTAAVQWHQPDATIQGQHGLVRHSLLSNKRMVLSRDTNNCVDLWDIVRCCKVKSFGQRDFDDVLKEVNVHEFGVDWCTVDTKIGMLSVQLQEHRCFDSEMYFDESGVSGLNYVQDARVNIGKWVLTSLFYPFREACYERDQAQLPPQSPDVASSSPSLASLGDANESTQQTAAALTVDTAAAQQEAMKPDTDAPPMSAPPAPSGSANGNAEPARARSLSTSSGTAEAKGGRGLRHHFRKFSMRRRSRTNSDEQSMRSDHSDEGIEIPTAPVPSVPGATASTAAATLATGAAADTASTVTEQRVTTMPPALTPIVLFKNIRVSLSAQFAEASSLTDLYNGSIADTVQDVAQLESVAPDWLLNFVLLDRAPTKEPVKIGFQLVAYPGSNLADLPNGNNRLSSNRMIRLRKLLTYVAEKAHIEPPSPAEKDAPPVPVEQYLEFVVNDRPVSHLSTLGTVRTYVWKGSGELIMHYRRPAAAVTAEAKP